jgi:transposase
MGKVTSKAVFKAYDQQQVLLLPQQLGDLIPQHHLVRVVNLVVDQMDLSDLINQYEGGGTSSYHPKMMVKVLLYGYSMKLYTGRKLAKALQQDVTFMWLAAYNRPDFRTLNLFRSGILKETIEELFKQLLLFLVDRGYIKIENYFTDGTTFSADASKHKMVWKKNAERFKQKAEENCRALFKQIDALNQAEEQQYGEQDLEEMGGQPVDQQTIAKQAEKLNHVISQTQDKRLKRKAVSLQKKVEEQGEKIDRYQQQLAISAQRSGYSKTDTDATAMYMKNQELLPAYNVVASSENQFITAFTVHQNPNDATCFKEHLEQLPIKPATITADSIFGTEQNYELLESYDIENYLKFPTFHREQTRSYKANPFLRENFRYNPDDDTYTCPNNRPLYYRNTAVVKHKRTGYPAIVKIYESKNCTGCHLAGQCKKSEEHNRTVKVNQQLDYYKNQARSNLNTQKGLALRRARGMEIESCFGDIKHNMGFRRFHLRGKQRVKTEIGLVAMAHNMRKIQAQLITRAA